VHGGFGMKKFAQKLASLEGKRVQVRYGDILEIMKLITLCDLLIEGKERRSIQDDVEKYQEKLIAKVDALKAKGFSNEQIMKRLTGGRK
jgi:hypothetical protein